MVTKTIDEDDDFTFGTDNLKSGKKADNTDKVDDDESGKKDKNDKTDKSDSEDEKKEEKKEEKESKDSDDKTDDNTDKSKKDDNSSSDDDDDEQSKKDDDNDTKKDDETEEDIFSDEKKSDDNKGRKRTLKEIGKKLEIDLTADDDDEEFETKLAEKLSKSRQEINLDGFSDDAKALIKHLNENKGDVESFFTNKNIIGLQSVLSLDPETKVRNVRVNELMSSGKTKAQALETVEAEFKEMSTREIKDMADDIDQQAKKLIQSEVKKMVGDKELKAAALRQQEEARIANERTKLKNYIEKQESFLGLKLTSDAKRAIERDIENGEFDKLLSQNPEQQKFAAYMFGKHGAKILKKINATVSESNRKGFNAATKKAVDALHKTDDEIASKKTGHHAEKRQSVKGPRFNSDDIE